MAIPHSELQKINPNSIIELFELELVEGLHYATGNPTNVTTLFRFHAGGNISTSVSYTHLTLPTIRTV